MITPSPAAIEAAAKFYEFLGQHGVAKTIRERKGFRTTAEVFAQFEYEITSHLLDRIADLEAASRSLIADVRSRYPGEELRCPHMIRLDQLTNGEEG